VAKCFGYTPSRKIFIRVGNYVRRGGGWKEKADKTIHADDKRYQESKQRPMDEARAEPPLIARP
jgi:hypothetical protein